MTKPGQLRMPVCHTALYRFIVVFTDLPYYRIKDLCSDQIPFCDNNNNSKRRDMEHCRRAGYELFALQGILVRKFPLDSGLAWSTQGRGLVYSRDGSDST